MKLAAFPMRWLLALIAILAVAPAHAAAKVTPAEAVVRAIYAGYTADRVPSEPEKRTFSPDLLKHWNEVQDAADKAGEAGVDFDVFLDAQDFEKVQKLSSTFTPEAAGKGKVEVTFTIFRREEMVSYQMVKTARGWKIDDIGWHRGDELPGNETLRSVLSIIRKDQLSPPPASQPD